MKIWYSVTRIPSIFQTSTHVWGKLINCLLVLGFKLCNLYFSSPYKKQIPASTLHVVFCLMELCLPHCPSFPLPYPFSCENSFSFLKSSLVVLLNKGYQPVHPVPTWSFSVLGDMSQFPAVGRNSVVNKWLKCWQPELQGKLLLPASLWSFSSST